MKNTLKSGVSEYAICGNKSATKYGTKFTAKSGTNYTTKLTPRFCTKYARYSSTNLAPKSRYKSLTLLFTQY